MLISRSSFLARYINDSFRFQLSSSQTLTAEMNHITNYKTGCFSPVGSFSIRPSPHVFSISPPSKSLFWQQERLGVSPGFCKQERLYFMFLKSLSTSRRAVLPPPTSQTSPKLREKVDQRLKQQRES